MDLTDVIWAVAIVVGALFVLYRSMWKKKGHCTGCSSEACLMKKK
jgi:hypothetical protein